MDQKLNKIAKSLDIAVLP